MKKIIKFLFILSLLIPNISFSQSGWVSRFLNNTSTISKIIKIDSLNFIGLSFRSKYYFKSTDSGNNWLSIEEYSFDSVYSLYDGQFINSQTGWVVGSTIQYEYGIIFKTTNGGINWNKQNTGFNNYSCYSLFFLNENTGWVGARGGNSVGYLMKTTNGGINWTKSDFIGALAIRSVKFLDNNNGWIHGTYGLIARTTDGGQTWLQKPINSGLTIYDMNALSLYECWVLVHNVSYGLEYSYFYKTSNGGDNWTLIYIHTDSLNTDNSLWKLNFINSSTGFSFGEFRYVVRTTSSGVNWSRINLVSVPYFYPVISSILPINSNEIFAGGGYSGIGSYDPYNYILKSTNTGLNWEIELYNWPYKFLQIQLLDNNSGFVIADSGRIFKTSNNGNNWFLNYSNKDYWFSGMSFANYSTGCIIGKTHSYSNDCRIIRTTNNGNNWNQIYYSLILKPNTIKFIDQVNGLIGCDSARILKTTNGGLNWYLVTLNSSTAYDISIISFIDNSTGWLYGHYYNYVPFNNYERNGFWKTTNGGNNWVIIYDSLGFRYNYGVQFFNNSTGYKISNASASMQRTTNGGVNWSDIAIPNSFLTYSMGFINLNTGWIAGSDNNGGIVYKTTDAGLHWGLQFREVRKVVRSFFIVDSSHSWFCGDHGSIYCTTNGGGGFIGINFNESKVPSTFSLSQNYPNPFNPVTRIKYDVPAAVGQRHAFDVRLIIYDILGREIETLVNQSQKPGRYEVAWDGSQYASGVYFYKLITEEYVVTKKMVLIK